MNETPSAQDESAGFDDRSVEPGVWRYARAKRASVIVDAADYFDLMQQAMLKARHRILLIGWDFDTRIHLARGRKWYGKRGKGKYPSRLGSFILWLNRHRDDLDVRILKWSVGILKFLTRGSMTVDLVRWFPHKRIDFKFDTAHPFGGSHHQKIAVLDNSLAVCGGIDMTTHRWDTRDHVEDDPRRKRPRGSYYMPWHDATMMMEGEVADVLDDLGRDRWRTAGGGTLEAIDPPSGSLWPDGLPAQFEDVEIGIARTRAEHEGRGAVNEVEQLFVRMIGRARRFIYAESQYFASRAIAEAIVRRLEEPDPPEIVIVNPISADGWIETQAMDHARARLVAAVRAKDQKGRFHILVPFTGEEAIYVHAKIMIVDDEMLRIGSANMNNRSMGLDSECDIFIDAARPGNDHARAGIAALRHSLVAEHCGLDEAEAKRLLEHYGSLAVMVREMKPNPRHLRPLQLDELGDIEQALADSALLDPETPDDIFAMPSERRGLFRKGGRLRKPFSYLKRKIRK